ncbi:SH3 domain-containing protein [Desulfovibrio caledoniensis]
MNDYIPPAVASLCEKIAPFNIISSKLTKFAEVGQSVQPLIAESNSLQPFAGSLVEVGRALAPLGQIAASLAIGKTVHPIGESLQTSGAIRLAGQMQIAGSAIAAHTFFDGLTVGRVASLSKAIRQVDWSKFVAASIEDEKADGLSEESQAAVRFLEDGVNAVLDKTEQSPQNILEGLSSLYRKAVDSSLGKAAKWIVCSLLRVMIEGIVFSLICSASGFTPQSIIPNHRDKLNATKQYVRKEVGAFPQLRIVSVQSRLNVRYKPNRKSLVVGELYPYSIIVIIDKSNKWTKVHFNGYNTGEDIEGWVFNKYLSKIF